MSGLWLFSVAAALAVATPVPPQAPPPAPGSTIATVQTPAVSLSLDEAIARGLTHNLAALRAEASVGSAEGRHWQALSALLPNASADASAVRQKINLAAFGFTAPGFPDVIGPFNVYDGRVRVSQAVVDLSALSNVRSEALRLSAAKHDEQDARRLVALVVTTLYVNAVAAGSRVEAVRAELESARTLAQLANDLKSAGIVPQIDVLRAQVQLESVEQREIVLANALDRGKLALAQAIGLMPVTPNITLTDRLEYPRRNADRGRSGYGAGRAGSGGRAGRKGARRIGGSRASLRA